MRTAADPRTVEDLVTRFRPLAEQLASLLLARVPRTVEKSDLHAAAMYGLFQAAQTWSDDRGVSFEAFARHRIRGALLDDLRSRDWASRRVRSFARLCASTTDELIAELGRRPTDAEIASRAGVPIAAVEKLERDLQRAALHSTDPLGDEHDAPRSPVDEEPEAVLVQREELGYLHDAVALLPERLRHVVIAYYVDERPMQSIADELDVTESRVSQMRAEAVRLLRAALAGALHAGDVDELAFAEPVGARALGMIEGLAGHDSRARLGLRLVG